MIDPTLTPQVLGAPADRPPDDDEPTDVSAKLRLAFSLAHDPLVSRARPLLRKRVLSFVDEKKDAGWSPDRIDAALKRLAHGAGLRLSETPAGSPRLADRI